MSIVYPLDMPTDVIGISSIELRAANVVAVSESPFTFRQQVFRHQGQRWSAAIGIAPVNREFGEPWVAFLLSLEGPTGTFLLGDPLGACPQGTIKDSVTWFLADGVWRDEGLWDDSFSWDEDASDLIFANPFVDGAQAAGSQTIDVKGLASDAIGVFAPGDYIQLGAGATATLHKILTSVDTDAQGEASIPVWPRPRRALVDDEPIVFEDAKGLFRLSMNEQAWDIANNLRYGVSFEAVEAT
jgi:hypothetical protein